MQDLLVNDILLSRRSAEAPVRKESRPVFKRHVQDDTTLNGAASAVGSREVIENADQEAQVKGF